MKLFQIAWLLGMLSYVLLGVLRRSGSSPADTFFGMQGTVMILLFMLPAGIGAVLGSMSLSRREMQAWWAIGAIVFNIAAVLTGIFLLFPG